MILGGGAGQVAAERYEIKECSLAAACARQRRIMELVEASRRRRHKMGRVGMGDVEARRGTRRTSERGLVLDFNILEESGACGSRQRHGSRLGRSSDSFPLGGHPFSTQVYASENVPRNPPVDGPGLRFHM